MGFMSQGLFRSTEVPIVYGKITEDNLKDQLQFRNFIIKFEYRGLVSAAYLQCHLKYY